MMATRLGGAGSGTRFANVTDEDIEMLVADKDSKKHEEGNESCCSSV